MPTCVARCCAETTMPFSAATGATDAAWPGADAVTPIAAKAATIHRAPVRDFRIGAPPIDAVWVQRVLLLSERVSVAGCAGAHYRVARGIILGFVSARRARGGLSEKGQH